jgi:hypothetical protein
MTIREIEAILEDLEQRHENLSEATLLVLLKAAGWEDKVITDAIALYRGKHVSKDTDLGTSKDTPKFFEKNIDNPVLVPEVDVDHLLLEHYPNPGNDAMLEVRHELDVPKVDRGDPQSLIEGTVSIRRKNMEEPPHNLPVKPYETTSHVWSFARFKSIFFGTSDPDPVAEEVDEKVVNVVSEVKTPPFQAQQHLAVVTNHEATHVIELHPTPLSRDEYRLVLLAGIMLLAILLLLGYMYGHGRI